MAMHSTNIDATDAARPADDVPTCPGCHFACRLDAYQCGKGKRFLETYQNGEPLPARGDEPAMPTQAAGAPRKEPPIDDKLAMGLGMLARMTNDVYPMTKEQELLAWLDRSNGFMAQRILSKRLRMMSPEELDEAIKSALDAGTIKIDDDAHAGTIVKLTPAGREEAARIKAEKGLKLEEFFAPLTPDEKAQLDSIMHSLIQNHKARGRGQGVPGGPGRR